jgi:hypothetical protein
MATSTELSGNRRFDGTAHAQLIPSAKNADSVDQVWLYLEAAHVVGQLHIRPHLQTHAQMFNLSVRTRDWPETVGQLLRLALGSGAAGPPERASATRQPGAVHSKRLRAVTCASRAG